MDIGRLMEGFLGSAGGAPSGSGAQQGGIGGTLKNVVDRVPGGAGTLGGVAAGGVVALMLGSKKARKVGGQALAYGGMAAVGALAYKAWRDHKNNQAAPQSAPQPASPPSASMVTLPTPPQNSGFNPAADTDSAGNDLRLGLIQAMISAAKADGHIDADENRRIVEQVDTMALAADEKAFLFDQMQKPSDPIAVATLARCEEQGAELYLVSALTIDPDTPEEQRYLERLGDALRLPENLRGQLLQHAAAARAEVA